MYDAAERQHESKELFTRLVPVPVCQNTFCKYHFILRKYKIYFIKKSYTNKSAEKQSFICEDFPSSSSSSVPALRCGAPLSGQLLTKVLMVQLFLLQLIHKRLVSNTSDQAELVKNSCF